MSRSIDGRISFIVWDLLKHDYTFTENYADAPITPEDYQEETNDIYHPCVYRHKTAIFDY